MRSITSLVFLILFFVILHAANVTEYTEYARNNGNFSDLIQAQDINQDPSQYFICKVALRESPWIKSLQNCLCKQRWYKGKRSFRCRYCDNTFWSQTNAIKVTYCSYVDWNLQIEKVFQTGKPQSRNWRQVACPKGQYASKIGARFGVQYDIDLGFIGLQIKCETINFSENSLVQDDYRQYGLSEISKNKQGLFASAFRVKYEPNGKLTGIKWGFEVMPIIVKIDMKYPPVDQLNPQNIIIDSVTVLNSGSKQVQQTVSFTKNHVIKNQWNTENSKTQGYEISAGVSVSALDIASAQTTYTSYSSTTTTFGFNKAVETTYSSTQQTLVIVPPGKRIEVKSLIMEKKVNLPFEATLTFADRVTKQIIATKCVNGMWEGVMASSVQVIITQSDIVTQPNIIHQTQTQLKTQTPKEQKKTEIETETLTFNQPAKILQTTKTPQATRTQQLTKISQPKTTSQPIKTTKTQQKPSLTVTNTIQQKETQNV